MNNVNVLNSIIEDNSGPGIVVAGGCHSLPFLLHPLPVTAVPFSCTAFHCRSFFMHCLSLAFLFHGLPFTAVPCSWTAFPCSSTAFPCLFNGPPLAYSLVFTALHCLSFALPSPPFRYTVNLEGNTIESSGGPAIVASDVFALNIQSNCAPAASPRPTGLRPIKTKAD